MSNDRRTAGRKPSRRPGEKWTVANKILRTFDVVFGCWHRNLSRPFTLSGWTYEVCLNCGKKLPYNRAGIGCAPQRGNLVHLGEPLKEGYASISFVTPRRRERAKAA